MKEFIDGNTAVVKASIYSGCNFFAGYPITPATSILVGMIKELPQIGGIAIQAEDEIASIGFCIGAAMTGKKVLTATSGPGLSLYSENIGLAIMAEVPMVIVDVQRMGPATGGATTNSEGDIQFIRWITSGGYPIIALSPTDVKSTYELTIKAFNLAEIFRTPVFLVSSKELALTKETVDISELENLPIINRKKFIGEKFLPYNFLNLSDTPEISDIGDKNIVRFTTSIHDERGVITTSKEKIDRKLKHLKSKIDDRIDEIVDIQKDFQDGSDTMFISYGVTSRSVKEAIILLREKGKKVSSLVIRSLFPVPEKQILESLKGIKRVIVPELNIGQYIFEIKRIIPDDVKVIGINRIDGGLISPESLIKRFLETEL